MLIFVKEKWVCKEWFFYFSMSKNYIHALIVCIILADDFLHILEPLKISINFSQNHPSLERKGQLLQCQGCKPSLILDVYITISLGVSLVTPKARATVSRDWVPCVLRSNVGGPRGRFIGLRIPGTWPAQKSPSKFSVHSPSLRLK